MRRASPILVVLVVLIAACGSGDDDATSPTSTSADAAGAEPTDADEPDEPESPAPLPAELAGYTSDVYADEAHWLCLPGGADDVCDRDLDATAILADGSTEPRPHERATDPAGDCFYVYPTISGDQSLFSDLEPGEGEEINTALTQAARYTASCRVFAPVYPQFTLTALLGAIETPDERPDTAFEGVVDAFNHYLANHNDGRGIVLVGHSQGAGLLRRLIAEVVEPEPALLDRFAGAHLLGTSVAVPDGETVGEAFTEVPLCEAADQAGCVITYSTYRDTVPPGDTGIFGIIREGDGEAGCVNPADPTAAFDETTTTEAFFATENATGYPGAGLEAEVTTPWVTYPDLIEVSCTRDATHTYLEMSVRGDPADARADDINGDLELGGGNWGLHLLDVNIAMGDLVELAAAQLDAHAA